MVRRWIRRHGHRVFHPLAGADIATLARLTRHGAPAPSHAHRLAFAWGAAIVRAPIEAIERVRTRDLPDLDPPPVFVLGHWRSGTTHLYNLLSRDPGLGFVPPLAVGLPWGFLGLSPFWRRRLEECLPEDRLIDAMPVEPDSPQEDELGLALMQGTSFYHGVFFPSGLAREFERGVFLDGCDEADRARWRKRLSLLLRKVQAAQPGRPIVVKNPAHSAKVREIRALWPEARFVHIHRDPLEVYASTRRMLGTLLRELALQPWEERAVDEVVLRTFPRMMDRVARDTADLPPDRLVEIRYEDLARDPLCVLARVYGRLGLDGFAAALPAFRDHLARVAGHRKAPTGLDPATVARVGQAWAHQFDRWGYDRPAASVRAA
jgi:hypothetical protein